MVEPIKTSESTTKIQAIEKQESSYASRKWNKIKYCSTGLAIKVMGIVYLYFLAKASAEPIISQKMPWTISCSSSYYPSLIGEGSVTIPINGHTHKHIVEPYLNSTLSPSRRNCELYYQLLRNGDDLTNFTFETPLKTDHSSSSSPAFEIASLIQFFVLGMLFL